MAESAPRHYWICTDISQARDNHQNWQRLTEIVQAALAAPGLYLLYCFSEHILPDRFSPGRAAIDLTRVLQEQLEGQALAPEPIDENDLPSLADDAIRLFLYAPDNPDGEPCQAAFAHFRERLTRPIEHPLFMLVSAGVYDGLRISWVISLALSDPNMHEVLLWDAGELPADQISDPDAWCGSGWIGPRCRDAARIQNQRFPFRNLATAFHQGLDNLIRLTRDPARPQADRLGRKDAYLSALSRFLPPLRGAGGLLIPATVGSWGGPRPWRRIEGDLSALERHLLLDGWLSLRDDGEGHWWIEPASLVLLAWVAWELNLRHCESPEAFLTHYAWEESPSWFGGRWRREGPGDAPPGFDPPAC